MSACCENTDPMIKTGRYHDLDCGIKGGDDIPLFYKEGLGEISYLLCRLNSGDTILKGIILSTLPLGRIHRHSYHPVPSLSISRRNSTGSVSDHYLKSTDIDYGIFIVLGYGIYFTFEASHQSHFA